MGGLIDEKMGSFYLCLVGGFRGFRDEYLNVRSLIYQSIV